MQIVFTKTVLNVELEERNLWDSRSKILLSFIVCVYFFLLGRWLATSERLEALYIPIFFLVSQNKVNPPFSLLRLSYSSYDVSN